MIVVYLDVDFGYIYSLLFGWRLMKFNGIIVGCLDVDYKYRYSLLFERRLIWLMSIIVNYLDRGSNNFMQIMPMW
jgi:hypothetical protein